MNWDELLGTAQSAPAVAAAAMPPCERCGEERPDSPPEKPHRCDDSTRQRYERKLYDAGQRAIEQQMRAWVRDVGRGRLTLDAPTFALLALWVHANR